MSKVNHFNVSLHYQTESHATQLHNPLFFVMAVSYQLPTQPGRLL